MQIIKLFVPVAVMLSAQLLWAQAPIFDASRPARDEVSKQTSAQQIPTEQNLQMEIYQQLQTLQQEVMELRGTIEEQGHQLRTLKQQSLDRYIELDRRIASGGGGESKPAGKASNAAPTSRVSSSVPAAEIDAYRSAYELVKAKQFSQAITSFQQFLKQYPKGAYAPNALYWSGELQLVNTPRDLKAAQIAFSSLLAKYPEHSKVPGAMYKLGKVYFLSGDKAASKKILDELIHKHGDSNRPAIKFARKFLQDNF
ncbi:MAG: tol-pal system protein YbgF [Bermanella sp.]|jgi:tol-pal system protein YbgF